MVAARESYRRSFAGLLDRALSKDGFVREGRLFTRGDATGNSIVLELQSHTVPGDCAAFFINVAVLLGIEVEVQRRRFSGNPRWRPTTAWGVWRARLRPEGWTGEDLWRLCSPGDAEREARRAVDGLRGRLDWLTSLMDPEVMLATAKAQRWARGRVVEGYLLAARGLVAEVEELLGTQGRDPSELLEFERYILAVARETAGR